MQLTPAKFVILRFGGLRATARELNQTPGAICRWNAPKSRHGCGGRIPSSVQNLILQIAKKKNLDITPNDILFGREIANEKK